MSNIKEDTYAKELLNKVNELKNGLEYYIDRTHLLENELDSYKIMYENRIEEYLKLIKNKEV